MGHEETLRAAQRLEEDQPDFVARSTEELRVAADGDHRGGVPRGRAYVRRIQELIIERPELGIAVARAMGLGHIAHELIEGVSVDGVPGIGPDGAALAPTRQHRTRRRGAVILAVAALVLLIEAVTADSVPSVVLYVWTAVGLVLFGVGGVFALVQE